MAASKSWVLRAAFVAVLVFFSFAPKGYAIDTPSLYGVSFPVDEISEVDPVSVRVMIGTDIEIVRRDDLGAFAAQKTFENPSRARRLPQSAVEQFVKAALEANDKRRLSWVVQGLCARFPSDEETVVNLLSAVELAPLGRDILKGLLELPQSFVVPDGLVPRILVLVGIHEPHWARGRVASLNPVQRSILRESLQRQILEALGSHSFEGADLLLALQRELYGEDDVWGRGARVFAARLASAVTAAANADVEPAFSLAAVSRSDAALYPIAVGVMLDAGHRQAEREIAGGTPSSALLILSRIDFDRRTPTTHTLTIKALELGSPGIDAALDDARVDKFLTALAEVDQRVKGLYVAALQRQVLSSLQDGKIEAAIDGIRRVTTLRGDPSGDNDALRFALARALLSAGEADRAKQVVSEMQTGVGLRQLLILGWDGYFGSILYALLIAGAVMLMGAAAYLALKIDWSALWPAAKPKQPPPQPVEEEDDEKDRPAGFSIVSARLFTPAMQEYHRCLEGLGLKPGASLSDIKKRYRNLVKKVHPDLNQNLTAEDQDRFVSLTKIYDRVIELRNELKISE